MHVAAVRFVVIPGSELSQVVGPDAKRMMSISSPVHYLHTVNPAGPAADQIASQHITLVRGALNLPR